jgi:hypothetical protein
MDIRRHRPSWHTANYAEHTRSIHHSFSDEEEVNEFRSPQDGQYTQANGNKPHNKNEMLGLRPLLEPASLKVKHKNFVETMKLFIPDREERTMGMTWTVFARAVTDAGVEIANSIGCRKHLLWRNLTLSIHKQHPDGIFECSPDEILRKRPYQHIRMAMCCSC